LRDDGRRRAVVRGIRIELIERLIVAVFVSGAGETTIATTRSVAVFLFLTVPTAQRPLPEL
jgi:hypothetical protein